MGQGSETGRREEAGSNSNRRRSMSLNKTDTETLIRQL